ncbi:MAG: hypothetical protein HXY46_01570 [Syntrophaceae bacterium]|nr:hypothetical protein [Syntrophaceae bacterium]
MPREISLEEEREKRAPDEEGGVLRNLEEKLSFLLRDYQKLKKERDALALALDAEKEKIARLERKLELLSRDREKVKTRIDQLLYRLKSVDL